MQKYTITVSTYDNQADTTSKTVGQDYINVLLDSAAPYHEQEMFAAINNPEENVVFLVDVSTDGQYYRWQGACYSSEVFAAMLTTALKKSLLESLSKF